jgi:hypothetical protein
MRKQDAKRRSKKKRNQDMGGEGKHKYCFDLPPDSPAWGQVVKPRTGLTLAHVAARRGRLPAGFSQWEIEDDEGWTVAHEAAWKNHLPPDFDQWDIRGGPDDVTVAHALAKYHPMPERFDQWELSFGEKELEYTVAHAAALRGTLPHDPTLWTIGESYGWPVALQMAESPHPMPEGFDQWDLSDGDGWTVAHEAALQAKLPPDVSPETLALSDDDGITVADVVQMRRTGKADLADGRRIEFLQIVRWEDEDKRDGEVCRAVGIHPPPGPDGKRGKMRFVTIRPYEDDEPFDLPCDSPLWPVALDAREGWTVAHEAASRGCLPEGFAQWAMADRKGRTVALAAAVAGVLPPGFDGWDLARNGVTIAEIWLAARPMPEDFDQWEMPCEGGMSLAHLAAYQKKLPEGFDRWELRDRDGLTVAHAAVYVGMLPEGFDRWDLAIPGSGSTVAHEAAYRGYLPPDVGEAVLALKDRQGLRVLDALDLHRKGVTTLPDGRRFWYVHPELQQEDARRSRKRGRRGGQEELRFGFPADSPQWRRNLDKRGWTLSHEAAARGMLPEGFALWELTDLDGVSVAEVAADSGKLPKSFDKWRMRDADGVPLAYHVYAKSGLPEGFDAWDACNDNGLSIAHCLAAKGELPPDFDRWELATDEGLTVAHVYTWNHELPKGFDGWLMTDDRDRTVAHDAAFHGHLPPWFDQWNISNREGWTVAHEAAGMGFLPEGVGEEVLALRNDLGITVADVLAGRESGTINLPDGRSFLLKRKDEVDGEAGEEGRRDTGMMRPPRRRRKRGKHW